MRTMSQERVYRITLRSCPKKAETETSNFGCRICAIKHTSQQKVVVSPKEHISQLMI